MDIMLPSGGAALRNYDDFRKRQLSENIRTAFDQLRDFCISLGDNVIEDIRPHRVVFCKSMNTRWFVDAKPDDDNNSDVIVIKIRKGWRDPIEIIHMDNTNGATQEIKDMITKAYDQIR